MQVFMTVFLKMMSMAFILVFGFILKRKKVLSDSAGTVIGQLATNFVFPCMAFSGLYNSVSDINTLISGLSYIVWGIAVFGIATLCAYLFSPLLTKDSYERSLFRYSLVFSNYGFFGIAVILSILGTEAYFPFAMFTIPGTILLYAWGLPQITPHDGQENLSAGAKAKAIAKSMVNVTNIAMLLGIACGLLGIKVPAFLMDACTSAGNLLSPLGMLLAGISVASLSFKGAFSDLKIWAISIIRLIVMPLIFFGVCKIVAPDAALYGVIICYAAMPLGMNTVVIPAAYGKDTTVGTKMTLISTLLCLVTIPLIVTIFL